MSKGFFEEGQGNKSAMRMMSFIALLTSIALSFLTLYTGNTDGLYLVMMFIVAAFAPKAVQKFAEKEIG